MPVNILHSRLLSVWVKVTSSTKSAQKCFLPDIKWYRNNAAERYNVSYKVEQGQNDGTGKVELSDIATR